MFGRKKSLIEFDPLVMDAVVKCSICTGEQVAGFKNIKTGQFTDVMLIKSDKDLELFRRKYNIKSITKEY